MILIEGIALCFQLLLICVILIKDGPVGGVVFYEGDVKQRVIDLGLTTKEKIQRTGTITMLALFLPQLIGVPLMVQYLNKAATFKDRFFQMTAIYLIGGLFDRIFIDWYWVGHTRAWIIEGTEDLRPYIPKKTLIKKWTGTLIGFPLVSALLAFILGLFK